MVFISSFVFILITPRIADRKSISHCRDSIYIYVITGYLDADLQKHINTKRISALFEVHLNEIHLLR